MKDMGGEVRTILASATVSAPTSTPSSCSVRQGRGTLGKLLNDDALYQRARRSRRTRKKHGDRAPGERGGPRRHRRLARRERPGQGLTGDVQQTLHVGARRDGGPGRDDRSAQAQLPLPRLLQPARLLRSGRRQRRRSTGRVRSRPKDRRALRIWLGADVLFERDANGVERLSEGGTARLDSAMSQFVRYPQNEPVRRRRLRPASDGGRAVSHQPDASAARPRLHRREVQAGSELCAIMPMGAEARGQSRLAETGMASRWRCSCRAGRRSANRRALRRGRELARSLRYVACGLILNWWAGDCTAGRRLKEEDRGRAIASADGDLYGRRRRRRLGLAVPDGKRPPGPRSDRAEAGRLHERADARARHGGEGAHRRQRRLAVAERHGRRHAAGRWSA